MWIAVERSQTAKCDKTYREDLIIARNVCLFPVKTCFSGVSYASGREVSRISLSQRADHVVILRKVRLTLTGL